jgi:hypothetical protein
MLSLGTMVTLRLRGTLASALVELQEAACSLPTKNASCAAALQGNARDSATQLILVDFFDRPRKHACWRGKTQQT